MPHHLAAFHFRTGFMPPNNVVITGLGIVSSIGIGREAFFAALCDQQSGITSLANRTDEGAKPGENAEPPGIWIGGPIIDFEPKAYVRPRKALKVMCREIQTAFAASTLAIEDAGLADSFPLKDPAQSDAATSAESKVPADRTGLVPADVGTVFGGEMYYGPPSEMEDAFKACCDDAGEFDASQFGGAAMKQVTPLWMLKYLPNMPACHVGISLGAHGPNNSLVLGDVSGPAAMMEACSCLDRSIAKVVVTGVAGTRVNTTRMNYRGDLPIPDVSDPVSLSSRPHDPDSCGVVGGEAAVSFVVESADRAKERGAKPIAKIASIVSRFIASPAMSDAKRSIEASLASGRGSSQAIIASVQAALDQAGLVAADIGAVISQASGDPSIDRAEQEAINACLPGVAVTAPIAALGHTGAAAGAMNVAVGALAIEHRQIPPTIGANLSSRTANFVAETMPLEKLAVVCLSHTSEGSAIATVLVAL